MLPADLTSKGFKLVVRDDTRSVLVLRDGRYQFIERSGLRMFAVSPTHGCSEVSANLQAVIASARSVAKMIDAVKAKKVQQVAA